MSIDDRIALGSIRRLDVKPGETVVLKLDWKPTVEENYYIRDQLREALPAGVRSIILDAGGDIFVIAEAST